MLKKPSCRKPCNDSTYWKTKAFQCPPPLHPAAAVAFLCHLFCIFSPIRIISWTTRWSNWKCSSLSIHVNAICINKCCFCSLDLYYFILPFYTMMLDLPSSSLARLWASKPSRILRRTKIYQSFLTAECCQKSLFRTSHSSATIKKITYEVDRFVVFRRVVFSGC